MKRKVRGCPSLECARCASSTTSSDCFQETPFIRNREVFGHRVPRSLSLHLAVEHTPSSFRERTLPTRGEFDKIFASQWLSHEKVVFGTKDNQLIVWNVNTNIRTPIPVLGPPHSLGIENCGIHAIAINDDSSVLATGANDPCGIGLYSLPSFHPIGLLTGHMDWMFGADWVTNTVLVSGCRQGKLVLWDGTTSDTYQRSPLQSHELRCKVRDVKADRAKQTFVALSTNGVLYFWDAHVFQQTSCIPLVETKELVCLADDSALGLVAVGSNRHVTLVDPRTREVSSMLMCAEQDDVEDGCGVRSVSIRGHTLTAGSGNGLIRFFDIRQTKISLSTKPILRLSPGYLRQDDTYFNHFAGLPFRQAVYTHTFDYSHTRMFVGGGPLAFGLMGSYAAVW